MNKKLFVAIAVLFLGLLNGCKKSKSADAEIEKIETELKPTPEVDTTMSFVTDSTLLSELIQKAYTWHYKNEIKDFPYKYNLPNDSIFTGIDWDLYNQNIKEFKKTDLFSAEFFKNHKRIATNLDKSIKKSGIQWRNSNGEIPIWNSEVDDWCNCQDYSDNFWNHAGAFAIKIHNDVAEFEASWPPIEKNDTVIYKMKANKEDGKWKISYLEGFKNYGDVKHYDKIMSK